MRWVVYRAMIYSTSLKRGGAGIVCTKQAQAFLSHETTHQYHVVASTVRVTGALILEQMVGYADGRVDAIWLLGSDIAHALSNDLLAEPIHLERVPVVRAVVIVVPDFRKSRCSCAPFHRFDGFGVW
jgi:hypothetical protein